MTSRAAATPANINMMPGANNGPARHAYSFTRYTREVLPTLPSVSGSGTARVRAPPVSLAHAGLQHTVSAELPGGWKR